ncbi:MAG: type IV toxin-antitoxin system AbiEi family antitoxin domain-containing protein, partial [Solirubrobacterales bacterium]|nr:type IV toxin-antitoxin system AbiEi family antitoxin domain-containing protein [Solirubrobacterales bacterium]
MGHGANDGYSRQNPPAFITRAQLHALGFSDHAIAHRVRRGSLIRVYRGVYAIGHLPTQPLDRAHAALLAVGERSALSHASA